MTLSEAKITVFGELGRMVRYLETEEGLTRDQTLKLQGYLDWLLSTAEFLSNINSTNESRITPIFQYTIQGEFVARFPSMVTTAAFHGFTVRGLENYFRKRRMTYKGYVWKMEGDNAGLDLESIINKLPYRQKAAMKKILKER